MIYVFLIILGILSALADRIISKKSQIIVWSVTYSVLFYCIIVIIRAFLSNGSDYLSFSFYGKGTTGYLKVCLLLAASYILSLFVRGIISSKKRENVYQYDSFLLLFSSVMVYCESLYIFLIGWPTLNMVLIIIIISLIIAVFISIVTCRKKDDQIDRKTKTAEQRKGKYKLIIIPLVLFCMLYTLTGPMELMLYNKGEFIFSFPVAFRILLLGTLCIVSVPSILISNNMSYNMCRFYSCIVSIYSIMSYLQTIFLNGNMSLVDGGTQTWMPTEKAVNLGIWVLVIFALVFIVTRTKHGMKVLVGLSLYIIAIQFITGIYILSTKDGFSNVNKEQLTEDGIFSLSDNANTVVFILDAYDTQMLQYVLSDDPDYLEPLHDFTYYDNMTSRYTATDGSLPYLLTGADINNPDIEKNQDLWYENSHFLKDIKNAGYDVRILTEEKYVDSFDNELIDNYSENNYCRLDIEKTMELFIRCMRYKSVPYVLKEFYRYQTYDITNVVTDTDIYVFGTDAEFDDKILNEGIVADCEKKAFRVYHLYGAHSPYYLTENADLDYDSTPLAQWKGSLKIVYDYINALKDADIYDKTTVIIMADHGFNNTQRRSVKEAGIDIDEEKTNPIFMIKRANETGDKVKIISKPVSHDNFFDTIMESVGLAKSYYGTVWD